MLEAEDWKVELQTSLNEIVDRAVTAGARAAQVFDALAEALQIMKGNWGRDPDPAPGPSTTTLDEPANDWPAANR